MGKEGPRNSRQGEFPPPLFRGGAELRREKEERHGEEDVPRVLFELASIEPQPRIKSKKGDGRRSARRGQELDRETAEVPQGPQREEEHGHIQRPAGEPEKRSYPLGNQNKSRGRRLAEGIGRAGEKQLPERRVPQPDGEGQRVVPELPAAVTVDAEKAPRDQGAVEQVPVERNALEAPVKEKGAEKGEKKGAPPEKEELFPKINGGVPRPPRSEVPGKTRSEKDKRNARRGGQKSCRRGKKFLQQKGGTAGVCPQSFPGAA